jgi:hypothetical protein
MVAFAAEVALETGALPTRAAAPKGIPQSRVMAAVTVKVSTSHCLLHACPNCIQAGACSTACSEMCTVGHWHLQESAASCNGVAPSLP